MHSKDRPLIEANNICYSYKVKNQKLHAVKNVSFHVHEGETLAIVGESGCGKSTIGKLLTNIINIQSGELNFDDKPLTYRNSLERRKLNQQIQMIYQDPNSALNPRMTVKEIIEEPFIILKKIQKHELTSSVNNLLNLVLLDNYYLMRYPHQLSGGQKQRVVMARALALNPKLLICDEPTASLDVSIQKQIIDLLKKIQNELNLTYILISHDLSIIYSFSTKVAVMYFGEIVEMAKTSELYKNPLHPYTQALLSSIPTIEPKNKKYNFILNGEAPSCFSQIKGCPFVSRCPKAMTICKSIAPSMHKINDHSVSCHLYTKLNQNSFIYHQKI